MNAMFHNLLKPQDWISKQNFLKETAAEDYKNLFENSFRMVAYKRKKPENINLVT
jgi:hypothetical protein